MSKSSHRHLPIKKKKTPFILKWNFIVVSGYTCRTAKGQNHKVQSVVAHILHSTIYQVMFLQHHTYRLLLLLSATFMVEKLFHMSDPVNI